MPEVPALSPRPSPRLSPLEPSVLGTVVMPADRAATILAPLPESEPLSLPVPLPVPLAVPDPAPVYLGISDFKGGSEMMINERTGATLTLEDVNRAVLWRRDTAEKLRQVPVGPRF